MSSRLGLSVIVRLNLLLSWDYSDHCKVMTLGVPEICGSVDRNFIELFDKIKTPESNI